MKAIVKMFAVLIILSSCSNSQGQHSKSAIENVDPKKFKELAEGGKGIILDVRTPEEVSSGYINNASTINLFDRDFNEKINLINM